jgi:hypothetical protein
VAVAGPGGLRTRRLVRRDLLDNFARPSARKIIPELQDLEVGQWLPYGPKPSERKSFIVDSFARPQWLLWRSRVRSWCWRLVPLPDGRTRLISRLNTFYDWRRPGMLVTVLLMEFGDYAMMRRMLRGIRERAEAERQRPAQIDSAADCARPPERRDQLISGLGRSANAADRR